MRGCWGEVIHPCLLSQKAEEHHRSDTASVPAARELLNPDLATQVFGPPIVDGAEEPPPTHVTQALPLARWRIQIHGVASAWRGLGIHRSFGCTRARGTC